MTDKTLKCCKDRLRYLKGKGYKLSSFICNLCGKIHHKKDFKRLLR